MGSVSNDDSRSKKRKVPMEPEGDRIVDRDGDGEGRAIVPPAADDVSSSPDVSNLDQASASAAASGCSSSVDMPSAGAKSEEDEPEDVEVETSSIRRCNFRGEDKASFGEEVIEGRRRPAEVELEEFFAAAERGRQERRKRVVEKYNFDFDMEEPLEGGRYEWTRFSPMKKKT